jgi:hypothetical protein
MVGETNCFAVVMSGAAFAVLYQFKADVFWDVLVDGLI